MGAAAAAAEEVAAALPAGSTTKCTWRDGVVMSARGPSYCAVSAESLLVISCDQLFGLFVSFSGRAWGLRPCHVYISHESPAAGSHIINNVFEKNLKTLQDRS